jgi:NitT/TauT family transport system substrate-binding protein
MRKLSISFSAVRSRTRSATQCPYRSLPGLLCLLALLSACAPRSTPTLTPITVQLNWLHYGLFGGLYAADQNGNFAQEGLAVTFLEGGPKVDYITPVLDGTAQFGLVGADELILARAQGKPVRAIATILRRSPLAFAVMADSGMTRPEDFIGHTIRITPQAAAGFHAMMARVGISPSQYTEIVLPSTLDAFASGQADVWCIYINSFAITVENAGYKLRFIYPDDYGVHFYAESLFTSDNMITTDPDLVQRFLRAALSGYTYAIENSAKVGPMVVKYNPQLDPAIATAQMVASLPLINTGEDHIGWMKPEIWAGMEQTLHEQGVLTAPLDVAQVYTLQFLEEIYGK